MYAAWTPSNRRIPMDIVEEILCNLPIKSLIRFRCVSVSWNSMISGSWFIRKHLTRAALSRKRLVIGSYYSFFRLEGTLSSISNKSIEDKTDRICPLQDHIYSHRVRLKASCDELCCVQVDKSLFLWNPSMRTSYRKLPDPRQLRRDCVYGMGYDSVGDDYKVFRVPLFINEDCAETEPTELYSLRTDAWKKIQPFPRAKSKLVNQTGKLLNGAVHWMVYSDYFAYPSGIISFDLSTEKYAEVPQPQYSPTLSVRDYVRITVLKGMLCVFRDYNDTALVLWVMKDYGIEESWTKIYDIGYNRIPSITPERFTLTPLYLYEDGEILIFACAHTESSKIVIYKDEKTIAQTIVVRDCERFCDAFIYVENLVSPVLLQQ